MLGNDVVGSTPVGSGSEEEIRFWYWQSILLLDD